METSKRFVLQAIACVKAAAPLTPEIEGFTLPKEEMPVLNDMRNGLCVVYLVDEGDGLAYVQNRNLSDTGFTPYSLYTIGMRNLAKRSDGKATIKQYGSVFLTFLDNLFEASLILRDSLWDDELADLAPNGFIAALPARGSLAFCDAKSAKGIADLKAVVKEAFSEDRPELLTQQLYQRVNGRWIAYDG